MRCEKFFKRVEVDFPVDVLGAEDFFEVAGGGLLVEEFEFGDNAIEAQADRGVRDRVSRGEGLEAAGGEDEAFDKAEVFGFEQVDPGGGGVFGDHGAYLNNIQLKFNFNKVKVKMNFMEIQKKTPRCGLRACGVGDIGVVRWQGEDFGNFAR